MTEKPHDAKPCCFAQAGQPCWGRRRLVALDHVTGKKHTRKYYVCQGHDDFEVTYKPDQRRRSRAP